MKKAAPAKKRARKRALTPKRARFVDEYLVDLNGTQAAIRAGFSARSAASMAEKLLRKGEVKELIQFKKAARAKRVGMTQDQVLEEVKILSRSSIDDYVVDSNGRLAPAPGCTRDVMRAVASVKYTRKPDGSTEVQFKLWDKPGSLRLSSQHQGMLIEKVEHSGELKTTAPVINLTLTQPAKEVGSG